MVRAEEGLEGRIDEVEEVGSNGEKQIARMLRRYGVRYMYEHPVAVRDRGKVRVWYPDFWLPEYAIAIEYVGGISSDDYAAGIEHKREVYRDTGVACVFVGADALSGPWPATIMAQMERILVERLARFDSLKRDL